MGYLKSISLFSGQDNLGGAMQLQVARKSEIQSIPISVEGVIYGDIIFKAGGAFYPWDLFAEMVSQDQSGREGPSKNNTLVFKVPKDRADLRAMFSKMEQDEFIVIFMENGKKKIFGDLNAPVRFNYSHGTGATGEDLNAFDCSFFYRGPDNVNFYDGSLGTPPVGIPPAVIKFNGQVLATLQPGETIDILSDYSFNQYFITQ